MKKKDIIEGKIIKTEFPNKGTFICEDQKVTVKGVIDGQTPYSRFSALIVPPALSTIRFTSARPRPFPSAL